MSDDEDVTPAEKLAICKHFINKTPAEEQTLLADDLQKLVGKEIFTDEERTNALAIRAEKFYDFPPKTDNIICCEFSKRDGGYLNPSSGKIVPITFGKKLEAGEGKDCEDWNDSDLRKGVEKALKAYMKDHYIDQEYASYSSAVYLADGVITIVISAKNTSLGNYWTGSWQSTYQFKAAEGKQEMKGTIKLNSHYFEAGNVQLANNLELKDEVEVGSDGKGVLKTLEDMENEFQTNMTKFFASTKEMFKNVRRGLTIQGTKFDWRAEQHDMVGQMG